MLQCCHGVDLLYEAFLELWVFDHLLFGEALDGVIGGGGGSFGGQHYMSEASFTDFAYAVELVGIKDVARLQLLAAFYHLLNNYREQIYISGK